MLSCKRATRRSIGVSVFGAGGPYAARLDLTAHVTFFVGENGSGKSTLLEGIAAAARLPAVGMNDLERDTTLAAQRSLAGTL